MKIRHNTESKCEFTNGDIIVVYTCPLCSGWERRFDLSTGKMTIKSNEKYFSIDHHGSHSNVDGFEVDYSDSKIDVIKCSRPSDN